MIITERREGEKERMEMEMEGGDGKMARLVSTSTTSFRRRDRTIQERCIVCGYV